MFWVFTNFNYFFVNNTIFWYWYEVTINWLVIKQCCWFSLTGSELLKSLWLQLLAQICSLLCLKILVKDLNSISIGSRLLLQLKRPAGGRATPAPEHFCSSGVFFSVYSTFATLYDFAMSAFNLLNFLIKFPVIWLKSLFIKYNIVRNKYKYLFCQQTLPVFVSEKPHAGQT